MLAHQRTYISEINLAEYTYMALSALCVCLCVHLPHSDIYIVLLAQCVKEEILSQIKTTSCLSFVYIHLV